MKVQVRRIPCRKKPAPIRIEQAKVNQAERPKNAESSHREILHHKKPFPLMAFPLSQLGDKPSPEMEEAREMVSKIKSTLHSLRHTNL